VPTGSSYEDHPSTPRPGIFGAGVSADNADLMAVGRSEWTVEDRSNPGGYVTATSAAETAFFDVLDPAFRVDSPEVRAAADAGWWARTPIGLAVLRYQECVALLRDRRLRHGSTGWLTARDVTSGPFAEWMHTMLLNIEGEPHQRQRRLVSAAFTQRRVERLRPFMRSTTHELVDTFAATAHCDFMTAFADPYPARVIAELLGIPDEQFDDFLGWANDMGLGFSPAVAEELDRIETALTGLYACCDELVARRRREPGDDLISALVAAADDDGRLTGDELRIMVSLSENELEAALQRASAEASEHYRT
jgi:hypothetical protein